MGYYFIMTIEYYGSTNEANARAAEAQIANNCGWPNGTKCWATVQKAVNEDFWFFQKPNGSHGFTQERMINGVTDVDTYPRDEAWFPEPEEI